jgi:hypothetical protein
VFPPGNIEGCVQVTTVPPGHGPGMNRAVCRSHVLESATGLHKGCFVVNTALKTTSHDAEFREIVTNIDRLQQSESLAI